MSFLRICSVLLLILSAYAQPSSPSNSDLDRRIERQVRAYTEAPPDARISIGARAPSGFAGYEKLPVSIEANGVKKTVDFLLAKDGSKLLYVTELDLTEDPYARNMRRIDINGRPWRGAEHGKVSIVLYDDFQCPFCSRMYVDLMNEVMLHYRDSVRVIMKDFPIIDAHPWALRAAVDSNCLALEDAKAYWAFSDYVHTHQAEVSGRVKASGNPDLTQVDALAREIGQKHNLPPESLEACLKRQDPAQVESSLAEGKSLGVSATPTIFINGQKAEGVVSVEQLRVLLDPALSEGPGAKTGQ
jgi:protein-disulfide isomerase